MAKNAAKTNALGQSLMPNTFHEVARQEPTPEPVKEPVPAPANPLAGMVEKKTGAKAYTYYLEDEVAQAIDKLAKQNKISKSKALNMLVKDLLLTK